MNQILFSKQNNKLNNTPINLNPISQQQTKKSKKWFILLFTISISIFIIVVVGLFYSAYADYKRANLYASLSNEYNISKLYSNNSATSSSEKTAIFTILGIIKIDKIKISLPIISTINDELLKIGPCKFSGPDTANTIGNLCIAAHNYDDNRFFSNISKLNINDEIQIYDTNGKLTLYKVFDKYETATNDTSCTLPLGNNTIELTLITCNNFTGNRIIVKAKSL